MAYYHCLQIYKSFINSYQTYKRSPLLCDVNYICMRVGPEKRLPLGMALARSKLVQFINNVDLTNFDKVKELYESNMLMNL